MRAFLLFIYLIYSFSVSFAQEFSANNTRDSSELEKIFVWLNLKNVQSLDSNIKVDLRYSSTNNFLKTNLYGNLKQAYLQEDVAEKLVNAQQLLKKKYPNYNLIIWDATRPVSIQQKMWDKIKVPKNMKSKYLANPKYGSLHNYGAAVDLSIENGQGVLVDMGTPFDSFNRLAYPFYEEEFLKSGKLSKTQYHNRQLLKSVMLEAGFMGITTEWWHYNSCYRKEAQVKYRKIYSDKMEDYISVPTELAQEESKDSLIFRVQIYTSGKAKSLSWQKLRHKADYAYFHEGLYKYTSGQFNDIKKANTYKNEMRRMGFNGSFIVPFYKGKRISLKDASELMQ